jgi:hypothetical protein
MRLKGGICRTHNVPFSLCPCPKTGDNRVYTYRNVQPSVLTVDELIEALQEHRNKPLRVLRDQGLLVGVERVAVVGGKVVITTTGVGSSLH